jgi:hypothetical protein
VGDGLSGVLQKNNKEFIQNYYNTENSFAKDYKL